MKFYNLICLKVNTLGLNPLPLCVLDDEQLNQNGKGGGYRFIYYLKTDIQILLITVYSKSNRGDILAETIHRIIANFDSQ